MNNFLQRKSILLAAGSFVIVLAVIVLAVSASKTGNISITPTAQAAPGMTIAYVGFATNNQPFWVTLGNSVEAHGKEVGVNVLNLTAPEANAAAQVKAVNDAIDRKVSAIIIGAVDSHAFGTVLDRAATAKIPIIAVDTGIDHPQVSTLIQTDNYTAAHIAGQFIADKTGKKGTVLIIGGLAGSQTGDARKDGVKDAVEAAGMKTIIAYGDWDPTKAAKIVQDQLTSNSDISAIFVAHDPGAIAVVSVLRDTHHLHSIIVVGFDALPASLDLIKAGDMAATIRQDPARMGREGIDLALSLIKGEKVSAYTPIAGVLIDSSFFAKSTF